MSLKIDLQSSEKGKRYLETLEAVVAEKGFMDLVAVAAKDPADVYLKAQAEKALKGDEDARLEVAQCIWQMKNQSKVHRR